MSIAALLVAYLIGSIPVGLFIVRITTGKDLRKEHSGRIGGTNAMRVGGFIVGLFTAIMDFTKSAAAVWLAKALTDGDPWIVATAGILSVLGHNYSIFLLHRSDGKIKLSGGAGGSPTTGAAMALWPPSVLIILPLGLLLLFGVGYASLATMTVGLLATIIFLVRALMGIGPWAYVYFGVVVEVILLLGLKPNIQRLLEGKERLIGWRAKLKQRQEKAQEALAE